MVPKADETGRHSLEGTNNALATESTSIAHGARQDSSSMKTIAVLAMIFLPATFVSSLLGTNLVAFDTNGSGRAKFVVSKLWWIYLVSAVPLTLLTLLVWWFWLQWRSKLDIDARHQIVRRFECATMKLDAYVRVTPRCLVALVALMTSRLHPAHIRAGLNSLQSSLHLQFLSSKAHSNPPLDGIKPKRETKNATK